MSVIVQLLKNTIYSGTHKAGDIIEVPNECGNRWLRNGIAVIAEEVKEIKEVAKPTIINENDLDNDNEDNEDNSGEELAYEDMSAKDLYKACLKKGLEIEPRQSKEYYLELLMAEEG